MKNFKGLQIKPDRLILLENGHERILYYDEIPTPIKKALSDIIVYTKVKTDMED